MLWIATAAHLSQATRAHTVPVAVNVRVAVMVIPVRLSKDLSSVRICELCYAQQYKLRIEETVCGK
jgi:hypothetical protein